MRLRASLALALLACAASVARAGEPAAPELVFLMDEDSPGAPGYFATAAAYYADRAPGARVVADARSLLDLRERLVELHQAGAPPFRSIVIVSHGADWLGLGVPLVPRGPQATLSRMDHAHDDGSFPPLASGEVDGRTDVLLESCGLGARADYLESFARLLGGAQAPRVRASQNQVGFRAHWRNGAPDAVERYELAQSVLVVACAPGELGARRKQNALDEVARRLGVKSLEAETELTLRPVEISIWVPPTFTASQMRLTQHLAWRQEVQDLMADYRIRVESLNWRVLSTRPDGALVRGVATQISAVRRAPIEVEPGTH